MDRHGDIQKGQTYKMSSIYNNNNNNRLFMAPHLLRAQSAYKDIRIHSLHYTHTHIHTHTHVTHTTNTCISIYTEIHRSQEKETERLLKWWGGQGK